MNAPFLTESQLAAELSERPGLIPVSIDSSLRQLIWLDLNGYHCYEGLFHQSLRMFTSMLRTQPACFTTAIDVLGFVSPHDSLPPTGFIFHPGRCGSTLLAKVLARSRENMVFSEAPPHNLAWKILPDCRSSAVALYRNLLLAMGRRRLPSYRAHFIKFASFSIMRFDVIRAAFPDTPAVFLFRQPAAVIESSAREVQPFLGHDFGLGRIWHEAGAAFGDFSQAALAVRDPTFRFLNYSGLTPQNLPSILRFFRSEPSSPGELALMQAEFSWDAKSSMPRRFVPRDPAAGLADSRLLDLYQEMAERSLSDWESAPA